MTGKSPALYKWRVTHSRGECFFEVEAAYSCVEETGHMVLKNADGNPVFTAEPGIGCTFERRERVSPGGDGDGGCCGEGSACSRCA